MRRRRGAVFVLTAFLATRLFLVVSGVDPISYPDTGGYFNCADALSGVFGVDYNFQRTPAYPALIALLGNAPALIVVAQMLMTLVTALAIYRVSVRVNRKRWPSLTAALLYILLLNVMSFDLTLLSEGLAAMLVTLSFAALMRMEGKASVRDVLVLAAATVAAVLTRPALFTLLPAYALLLLPEFRKGGRVAGRMTLFVSASVIPLLFWMLIVHGRTSMFTIATTGPYYLSNQTGAFMEHASDSYEPMRGVYVAARDELGTHRMTIYRAAADMQTASHLSRRDFDRELMAMNISAITARPDLYLKEVVVSWVNNWKVVNPSVEFISALPGPSTPWNAAAEGQKYVLLILTSLFLLSGPAAIASTRFRSLGRELLPFYVVVVPYTLLTALAESPNPRYIFPMIPLLVIAGFTVIRRLVSGEVEHETPIRPYWGGVLK